MFAVYMLLSGVYQVGINRVSATIHAVNDEPSSFGTFESLTDFTITVSGRASRLDLSLKALQKGIQSHGSSSKELNW
jgi:hypothetical protein